MAILSAEKVTKRFGGLVAVNSFDFIIDEGAIKSIIGPNGAGKTTFFNCITGFYASYDGEVDFNGEPIHGLSADQIARQGIARTYQNIRLFPAMTAIENILVGEHPKLKTFWAEAIVKSRRYVNEEQQAEEEAKRLLRYVELSGLVIS
jgi:branched-chain amino acid transport system ATP-binding protein